MKEKTLDISTDKEDKKNISDLKIYGDENTFRLLCKASSQDEGWMKSTKVCNVEGGCLVQVSTQQRNPGGSYSVAEALTYVPGVQIDTSSEPRKLVPIEPIKVQISLRDLKFDVEKLKARAGLRQ